jgi:hypothetical protein
MTASDAMALILLALLWGSLGIAILIDFRGLTRHVYERAVRFWARAPLVGFGYQSYVPYAALRYGVGIWFVGTAVASIIAAALKV